MVLLEFEEKKVVEKIDWLSSLLNKVSSNQDRNKFDCSCYLIASLNRFLQNLEICR